MCNSLKTGNENKWREKKKQPTATSKDDVCSVPVSPKFWVEKQDFKYLGKVWTEKKIRTTMVHLPPPVVSLFSPSLSLSDFELFSFFPLPLDVDQVQN